MQNAFTNGSWTSRVIWRATKYLLNFLALQATNLTSMSVWCKTFHWTRKCVSLSGTLLPALAISLSFQLQSLAKFFLLFFFPFWFCFHSFQLSIPEIQLKKIFYLCLTLIQVKWNKRKVLTDTNVKKFCLKEEKGATPTWFMAAVFCRT